MNTNNSTNTTTNREYMTFNLAFEYDNYSGFEKYAIATDIPEKEFLAKYGDTLKAYEPFILITWEMGMAMKEYNNNEAKYRMRTHRGEEVSVSEIIDEFYGYDDQISKNNLDIRNENIMIALNKLSKKSRERVIKRVVYGYTDQEIADATGSKREAVTKDIGRSLRKLELLLADMGVVV